MTKLLYRLRMVVWQRSDDDYDYVYGYDESIAPEPILARIHHELAIGELSIKPEQFEEDKPWLVVQRSDITAIDRRLGLNSRRAIETGDDDPFTADAANREQDVEYLVVLNAVRSVIRSHPEVDRFIFTEINE